MRRRTPPMPRTRPSQQRSTVTVDVMVTAVEIVLDKYGPGGLTTNRVAKVAGVGVGTLYHYFPNKEALVGALQQRVLDHLLGAFRRALAGTDALPIGEVVARIGAEVLGVYLSQRPMHRWLIELRSVAAYQERFRRMVDVFVAESAEYLAARPDLELEDPQAAAFMVVTAVEGIAANLVQRPTEVNVAAVTREAAQMIAAYVERWVRK